eukprot:TRINITY_DN11571_c0_g1_i2.p1 TRINITY_DN11571_c0_g1~~TRINITY_DN11571_c0_g1_i2.p1  ORF type:complete len:360 (+),score=47.83 TRINITY_DN11571_c0_g1_i2:21-1100(+)
MVCDLSTASLLDNSCILGRLTPRAKLLTMLRLRLYRKTSLEEALQLQTKRPNRSVEDEACEPSHESLQRWQGKRLRRKTPLGQDLQRKRHSESPEVETRKLRRLRCETSFRSPSCLVESANASVCPLLGDVLRHVLELHPGSSAIKELKSFAQVSTVWWSEVICAVVCAWKLKVAQMRPLVIAEISLHCCGFLEAQRQASAFPVDLQDDENVAELCQFVNVCEKMRDATRKLSSISSSGSKLYTQGVWIVCQAVVAGGLLCLDKHSVLWLTEELVKEMQMAHLDLDLARTIDESSHQLWQTTRMDSSMCARLFKLFAEQASSVRRDSILLMRAAAAIHKMKQHLDDGHYSSNVRRLAGT